MLRHENLVLLGKGNVSKTYEIKEFLNRNMADFICFEVGDDQEAEPLIEKHGLQNSRYLFRNRRYCRLLAGCAHDFLNSIQPFDIVAHQNHNRRRRDLKGLIEQVVLVKQGLFFRYPAR